MPFPEIKSGRQALFHYLPTSKPPFRASQLLSEQAPSVPKRCFCQAQAPASLRQRGVILQADCLHLQLQCRLNDTIATSSTCLEFQIPISGGL